MEKVFICCPYRGENVRKNLAVAKKLGSFAILLGHAPIVPQMMYPEMMDEDARDTRVKALKMDAALLEACDCIWIIGDKVTPGMAFLIEQAKALGKRVRLYDTECNHIPVDTMAIDDRVSMEMAAMLEGACVE